MLQLHSTTVLRHFRLSVCHALLLGEKAKPIVTQSTVAGQVADESNRRGNLCQSRIHTIRQPGFDLPRHTWSLLNRFRAGQGPCRANLHKWDLAQSRSCDCGQRQTMNQIVDTCPLTKFEGGLNLLHEADDDGIYSDCSTREIITMIRRVDFSCRRVGVTSDRDKGTISLEHYITAAC